MPRKRKLKKKAVSREGVTYALAYCRVSSDKQKHEGNGLETQEQRCRAYASGKGYEVAEVFKDAASGGGAFTTRAGQVALLKYIDTFPHRNFVVIVDDISRMARDVAAHFAFKQELVTREVSIESPNFNFEDTAEGEVIENVMAAFSQYHRKSNARQVVQKQKARVEMGFWAFRAPKGYKMVKDPMHGKVLVHDEEFAPFIKHALEGFASGVFPRIIDCCRYLCEQGYWVKQSPEKYIDKFKTDLLMNSVYAGFVEHEGWEVERREGFHEGIISKEVFFNNQKRLESESLGKRVRVDVSESFPLRGLVVCEHCNKPMTAANSRSRKNIYPYYFCQNKSCQKNRKNIPAKTLHGDFIKLLKKQKLKGGVDLVVSDVFDAVWKEELSVVAKGNKGTDERIKEVRKKMNQYANSNLSDDTPESMKQFYRDELVELAEEYSQLKNRKHIIEDIDIPYRTALDKSTKLLKSPYDIWVSVDVHEKQRMFFFVFDKKLPYSKETGYRTEEILCATRLFEEFVSTNSHDVEMAGVEPASELGCDCESTACRTFFGLKSLTQE